MNGTQIMNILITAIGSFSAECVVDSYKEINTINKIIGCDIYPKEYHNITKKCDFVLQAPLVSNRLEYKQFIIDTCSEYDIDLIIPLTDLEVDFFNSNRDIFNDNNIQVTIGSFNFLSIARNKKKLSEFLKQNHFDAIKTYSINDLDNASFPIIGKPIDGRSSEGLIKINSINEVNNKLEYANYIFQEFIDGRICTVDYIRDRKTERYCALPRIELLRTTNGAGMTVEIVHNPEIIELANEIGSLLDVHGCINFEFIVKGSNYYLIDLNPRFSAGVGFSKLAGYDFPKNLLNLYTNKELEPLPDYPRMILQKKIIEVVNMIY